VSPVSSHNTDGTRSAWSATLRFPLIPFALLRRIAPVMSAGLIGFNGSTRVEVIAILANCGRDTDKVRRALVTWIQHKQYKGRTTEHILAKLRSIESKFIMDTTLHSAFRDARAETCLPSPDLPPPSVVKRKSEGHAPVLPYRWVGYQIR
jgi:hypothetical protein